MFLKTFDTLVILPFQGNYKPWAHFIPLHSPPAHSLTINAHYYIDPQINTIAHAL